ncbi:hypothetical protein SASPL_129607 [Salvia splendens]|uniref:Retroviral polymerase SH3-like domain-containing protein n=1 Tax=Salvia splendens TaxID=180675 RepID=A0A8X8ZPK8_SALSN|nr:hypothetical protein SASPL_129607 [Salvia splendens]
MPKIPKAKRIKFDDKGEKCIFVGYGDRVMGYKLYNPLMMKVIIKDAREIEGPESAESSLGPGTRPRRMRNLSDLYETTKEVDEAIEVNHVDEEINVNEKNDTFSLTTLAEGRKAIGVK